MTDKERDGLVAAFRRRFKGAEASVTLIRPGRYRFNVVAPQFSKMTQLARQDAVWEVVENALSPEAVLDVTVVLAYAPQDLGKRRKLAHA